jgi:hypothetical protein
MSRDGASSKSAELKGDGVADFFEVGIGRMRARTTGQVVSPEVTFEIFYLLYRMISIQ